LSRNCRQLLDKHNIPATTDLQRRVQSIADQIGMLCCQGRGDNTADRRDTIVLQHDEERIIPPTGRAQIFNDLKLLRQLEHPHAIGKQAFSLDYFVVGVHRCLVFLIPLASLFRSIGCMKIGQAAPQGVGQQFRQVNAGLAGGGKRLGVKFDRYAFAHGSILT
jgi:hypothetical protein